MLALELYNFAFAAVIAVGLDSSALETPAVGPSPALEHLLLGETYIAHELVRPWAEPFLLSWNRSY